MTYRIVYTAFNPGTRKTVHVEYDTGAHNYVIRTTLNASDWPRWEKDERQDAEQHAEKLAANQHQRSGDSEFGAL